VLPLIEWQDHDMFSDAFHRFDNSFQISPSDPDYPIDYMKSVLPVPCHSHNDYWRQRPLFSALGTGCVSVEADIWLISDEIYVGHSEDELTEERTLQSLYIDPLVRLLDFMNSLPRTEHTIPTKGVFYQNPSQNLILLIDFKSPDIWDHVVRQLAPLRERGYLTHWNGRTRVEKAVTIVATGDAPFDLLISNTTYRDIFYDAPLAALEDAQVPDISDQLSTSKDAQKQDESNLFPYKYNPSNSYYASSSLTRAVGPLFGFSMTQPQIELVHKQVQRALDRGLVPRYWGTPRWPRGLRDEIWSVLLQSRVGVLNVDDLRAARKGSWGMWSQGD
jgi:hypothetical protein